MRLKEGMRKFRVLFATEYKLNSGNQINIIPTVTQFLIHRQIKMPKTNIIFLIFQMQESNCRT